LQGNITATSNRFVVTYYARQARVPYLEINTEVPPWILWGIFYFWQVCTNLETST